MLKLVIVNRQYDTHQALRKHRGTSFAVVIDPPAVFHMSMYHIICPTAKEAERVRKWLRSQNGRLHYKEEDKHPYGLVSDRSLIVFTLVPCEGKSNFPTPKSWEIE